MKNELKTASCDLADRTIWDLIISKRLLIKNLKYKLE